MQGLGLRFASCASLRCPRRTVLTPSALRRTGLGAIGSRATFVTRSRIGPRTTRRTIGVAALRTCTGTGRIAFMLLRWSTRTARAGRPIAMMFTRHRTRRRRTKATGHHRPMAEARRHRTAGVFSTWAGLAVATILKTLAHHFTEMFRALPHVSSA